MDLGEQFHSHCYEAYLTFHHEYQETFDQNKNFKQIGEMSTGKYFCQQNLIGGKYIRQGRREGNNGVLTQAIIGQSLAAGVGF